MTALAGWDGVADDMIPTATTLAFDVHTLDPAAVADTLAGLDVLQLRTLCVVLAAMVDIDREPAALLAWLRDPCTPLPVRPDPAAAEHAAALDAALSRRTA